jgi:hypothetical protein
LTQLRTGNESVYQDSSLLFEQTLTHVAPEIQAELLTRFLRFENMPPPLFDQYCQVIYEHLREPADNLPVWDHIKPKELIKYAAWVKDATIGSHFGQNQELARFFLRYRRALISVVELDRDTIVMNFQGFSITHSRKWPDTAMYRDQTQPPENQRPEHDPGDGHADINPADPRRPHRLPLDSLKKARIDGRVLLLLDHEGIKQSGVFIDFCLSRL